MDDEQLDAEEDDRAMNVLLSAIRKASEDLRAAAEASDDAERKRYLDSQLSMRAEHHLTLFRFNKLRDDALLFPACPVEVVFVDGVGIQFLALGSARQGEHLVGHLLVPPVEPLVDRSSGTDRDGLRMRLYPCVDGTLIRHFGLSLVDGTVAGEVHHIISDGKLQEIPAAQYWAATDRQRKKEEDETLASCATELRAVTAPLAILATFRDAGERAFLGRDRAQMLGRAEAIEAALKSQERIDEALWSNEQQPAEPPVPASSESGADVIGDAGSAAAPVARAAPMPGRRAKKKHRRR